MLRNLVTSLFLYEKIVTTQAKAKELRRVAEKMISLAKREDLHSRRQAAEIVQDERALKKLFETIGGRYKERNGGYTRITKLDYRMGDGAPLAAIELIGPESVTPAALPSGEAASPGGAEGEKPREGRRRRWRRRRRGQRKPESSAASVPAGPA